MVSDSERRARPRDMEDPIDPVAETDRHVHVSGVVLTHWLGASLKKGECLRSVGLFYCLPMLNEPVSTGIPRA